MARKDCRRNPGHLWETAVKSIRVFPPLAAKMKKRKTNRRFSQKRLDRLPGKRGRPTVPDNFLLGARNSWLYYLEEAWPEIGLPLLNIRKAGIGTIEDIQKIFEPVQSKDNCDHGKAFLHGSPQPVEGKELRRTRIRNSALSYEIQEMQSQHSELLRSCVEAENTLRHVDEQEKEIVQTEIKRRKESLLQLEEGLRQAESKSNKLNKVVLSAETYWYCSQLLAFLSGKKRYAVTPIKLANALAGLPQMGWRESFIRCSKMQRCSSARLPYRVVQVVSCIWRGKPRGLEAAPTEFFRAKILELHKKDDDIRETLRRAWRDLRLAINECWNQHSDSFAPFAISSAFLRNRLRSKTAAERILDEREAISTHRLT
jgi:hypothetical protein